MYNVYNEHVRIFAYKCHTEKATIQSLFSAHCYCFNQLAFTEKKLNLVLSYVEKWIARSTKERGDTGSNPARSSNDNHARM